MHPYPSSPYQAKIEELMEENAALEEKIERYEHELIMLHSLLKSSDKRSVSTAQYFIEQIVSRFQLKFD